MTKKTPTARRTRTRTTTTSRLSAELTAGIAAALDKKAVDIIVLDLTKGSTSAFTDFFVICTGANTRQVKAIADGVQAAIAKTGAKPALVEGTDRAEWVLVDYFDFVFHIFTPATREFYGLERLWGDAEKVEVPA